MSQRDSHDVIVVGAGASGLAAATALYAAGRDTVCLEARDRVGGRLLSAPAPLPERAYDLGATWFWDGEERVRTLAARLGVETFDQHLVGDTLLQEATAVRRLPGNLVDAPARRFAPGAEALARALAAGLPTDVVRRDSPVTAIRGRATGGVEVRTPDAVLHAGHVVLAVPPALALARIDFGSELPADLVRLARATPVWMGAVAKVVAGYPTAFWRAEGLAGAAVSRTGPLQELHDMSGPDGQPAALFGFAAAQAVGPGFEQAVIAQLTRLFGPGAAEPETLHVRDWSSERWTAPPGVHRLADHSLFGHPLYQRPALGGRLHWATTETATRYAGHIEGALAAGERAARAILSLAAGSSAPGSSAPGSPAAGSPAAGSPAVGSVAPGSPAAGSVAPGSPAVGSVAPGSPAVGSVAPGSPAVGSVAPGPPAADSAAPDSRPPGHRPPGHRLPDSRPPGSPAPDEVNACSR